MLSGERLLFIYYAEAAQQRSIKNYSPLLLILVTFKKFFVNFSYIYDFFCLFIAEAYMFTSYINYTCIVNSL